MIGLPARFVDSIFFQVQGHRIDAVAHTCRLRTIIENVPQMRVATAALHLSSQHSVTAIGLLLERFIASRCVEARPATA